MKWFTYNDFADFVVFDQLSQVLKVGFPAAPAEVDRPCAVIYRASLTATPIFLSPTSNAMTRMKLHDTTAFSSYNYPPEVPLEFQE